LTVVTFVEVCRIQLFIPIGFDLWQSFVCLKTIVFGRTYVLLQMLLFIFYSDVIIYFFCKMRSPRCVGQAARSFARWSDWIL